VADGVAVPERRQHLMHCWLYAFVHRRPPGRCGPPRLWP
jgi:hypothetical protein